MGIPEALGLRYNQWTFSESTTLPSLGTPRAGWLRRPRAPSSTAGLAGTLEMPDNEEACQRGTSRVPLQRPRCFSTKSTSTKRRCFVFFRVHLQRSWFCVQWGGGEGAVRRTKRLLFRLDNLFYNSTYHISGSDGLIIPYTVTNGRMWQSSIFTVIHIYKVCVCASCCIISILICSRLSNSGGPPDGGAVSIVKCIGGTLLNYCSMLRYLVLGVQRLYCHM